MMTAGLIYMMPLSVDLAQSDPHGWILTLTSVSVVFSALVLLWLMFSGVGRFFKWLEGRHSEPKPAKKAVKKAPAGQVSPEVAAAISMALEREFGAETYAAIGMALHLHFSESVHDAEPFVLTMKPSGQRPRIFRKY